MPITTSLGGFYKSELDWQNDIFKDGIDPKMNKNADEFLNERTQPQEPDLDLGLPPEDQTNPLYDVDASNPQPTLVSNHTGFRQGDNIEDRRGPDEVRDTVTGALKGLGKQMYVNTFGQPMPPKGEPDTPLAKDLGVDDVKLEARPDRNKLMDIKDALVMDAEASWTITREFARALKEHFIDGKELSEEGKKTLIEMTKDR